MLFQAACITVAVFAFGWGLVALISQTHAIGALVAMGLGAALFDAWRRGWLED